MTMNLHYSSLNMDVINMNIVSIYVPSMVQFQDGDDLLICERDVTYRIKVDLSEKDIKNLQLHFLDKINLIVSMDDEELALFLLEYG